MEFGKVDHKSVREFLRSAELLLGELRDPKDGVCSAYELMLIRTYLESLKAAVAQTESSTMAKVQEARHTPDSSADTKS
jgi:hypothetical protein